MLEQLNEMAQENPEIAWSVAIAGAAIAFGAAAYCSCFANRNSKDKARKLAIAAHLSKTGEHEDDPSYLKKNKK